MIASFRAVASGRPTMLDVALALALLTELEFEAWADSSIPDGHRVVTAIAVVLFVLPVVFRRRLPGAALVGCAGVAAVQAPLAGNILVGMTGILLVPLLLAYTLGTRREVRDAAVPLAVTTSLLWVGLVVSNDVPEAHRYGSLPSSLLLSTALIGVPWIVGQAQRRRERRILEFRRLAGEAEEETARSQRIAVAAERLRIGAELHDLIAQNISAISLQAMGASGLIASDVDRARRAMLAIERSARESLDELRHAVSVLRADPRTAATAAAAGRDGL